MTPPEKATLRVRLRAWWHRTFCDTEKQDWISVRCSYCGNWAV